MKHKIRLFLCLEKKYFILWNTRIRKVTHMLFIRDRFKAKWFKINREKGSLKILNVMP